MKEANDEEYVDTPPAVNLKCIVFTAALASGYWFLPPGNKWVLLALLYFPYLAMAWYDHVYACERTLGPTYLAMFYKMFKPPGSDQVYAYENWNPAIKRKVFVVDAIVLGALISMAPRFLDWTP